jgi:hypothetical protein
MSLTETVNPSRNGPDAISAERSADLKFVPKYLAAKCQQLIETYHSIHGYACLPDMLWQSDVRNFIEARDDLQKVFRKASVTRSAKKANEGFVLIATAILSIEVLSSDFAGWGRRFPWAKRKADSLRRECMPDQRSRLMDMYLYPHRYINAALINALAPPDRSRPGNADGMMDRAVASDSRPPAVDTKAVRLTAEELGWAPVAAPLLTGA